MVSSFSIYFLGLQTKMGIRTFTWGITLQNLVQIGIQIHYLAKHSPKGCYSRPSISQIFSNSKPTLAFLVKFGFALLCESFCYYSIPLFLLLGNNPERNVRTWAVVAQSISLIFFLGFSVSAYVRSLANPMLANGNYKDFHKLLTRSSIYFFGTLSVIGFAIFVFSENLASLFFKDPATASLLANSFRKMSIFYISEGFMVKLNSELRMLGFEAYVFWVAFALFVCFFPPTLLFFTSRGAGALTAIGLIGFSNSSVCGLFIFRLVKGFKRNFILRFNQIHNENYEFLISQQIPLELNN